MFRNFGNMTLGSVVFQLFDNQWTLQLCTTCVNTSRQLSRVFLPLHHHWLMNTVTPKIMRQDYFTTYLIHQNFLLRNVCVETLNTAVVTGLSYLSYIHLLMYALTLQLLVETFDVASTMTLHCSAT